MSLINIEKTIELDVYDHDTTPSVIKAIQMDEGTRTVFAMIQNSRQDYDIGQNASVSLTVLRPDKTKVQIVGQTFGYTGTDSTMYGAKAELSDVALAVKGNLKAQFKITSGEQELRTEIFTINNGEALDAGDGDWAGDLDGHNLDEMAESIETLQTDMAAVNEDVSDLKEDLSAIQTATASDVGKALKAKTVTNGKVTEWEFGEAGGNNDLLNNLFFDSDNNVYHRTGEEYTQKVQFANGAIISGSMDTQPVIAYHGKGLYTGDPVDRTGVCVTGIYPIGVGYTVMYYLANPASASAGAFNRYQIMNGATVSSSKTVTVESVAETVPMTDNGIRFTLYEAGVGNSYAYIKQTGEVLFAGENTAYFGMRNIDGTKVPLETLISNKNAESELLSKSGLIVGKDGLVHLNYEGGASAGTGIQFADGTIVNAQYDTKIRIAEYGKLIDGVTPYVIRTGGCYTEFYDLVSENAVIKYYFPNPDGASFSNNNKIEWYRGDTYVGRSNETLNSVAETSCSNTETKANKFRVSLATAGIDDSYCYDKATGTVIFAGKNTAYYGLNNIADQPDPDPRDYGVIGANYPEETALIDSSLANAQTYGDKTGITNRFAFCHVSDVHMHSASVRGFGYADEFTDLSDATFLALTGDNVSNTAADTFDHAKAIIDGMTKPCYITFGNHDVYGSTSLSSRFDHQFAQIKDHNGQSELSTTYYAVDIALGKQAEKLDTGGVNDDCNGIKCLFLDCYDGVDDYTGQNMSYVCDGHMSATQINWLATQLQDAITNKYHVCIFMHHAPDDCGTMIDKFFDSHGYAGNLLFIAKMVDAFQTYNGSVTFEHMGASYTFTFSGSGHFVSYFVGHTHCDGACWLKNYPRQLSIGVVTPSGSGSMMNGTNMNTGLGVMFNYVTIDKKKRKVTVFRVGNQDTYYGYKRDLFSVRYY